MLFYQSAQRGSLRHAGQNPQRVAEREAVFFGGVRIVGVGTFLAHKVEESLHFLLVHEGVCRYQLLVAVGIRLLFLYDAEEFGKVEEVVFFIALVIEYVVNIIGMQL